MHRTVPFAWMSLYDKLQAEKQAGNLVVGMDKVLGFARDCDVASGDVSLVLRYFNCMGLLLNCTEARMHGSAVVLDTISLLVSASTLVLCQHYIHLENLHQKAAQTMVDLWQDLINYGILDLSVLPLLWKDFESSSRLSPRSGPPSKGPKTAFRQLLVGRVGLGTSTNITRRALRCQRPPGSRSRK